ncbi:MAG: CrcB family protein [Haloarculaceae archaeon]
MTEHGLKRAEPLVLIAVGGFAGAILRRTVTVSLPGTLPVLPGAVWGTLTVNVVGSFALGVLLYEAHLADALTPETRLIVGTGFLSSFTTYSTFAVDTAGLAPRLAVLNVVLNYALGFLAVALGQLVARWVS